MTSPTDNREHTSPEEFLQEFAASIVAATKATNVDAVQNTVAGWAKLLELREQAIRADEARQHLANLRDNGECVTCYGNYSRFRDRLAALDAQLKPQNGEEK